MYCFSSVYLHGRSKRASDPYVWARTRARHAREVKFGLYEIPIVRQPFAISMRYARRFNDRFGASRQS